jgi:hypothetical protein
MRKGFNPNKDKKIEQSDYFHQVIVPVYLPKLEGYFKDGLTILKYCLESLLSTSHSQTYLTIVNNGSCGEVVDYLVDLKCKEQIHELIHTSSIGKLNSVLKGIVGHSFPLITITDSDVLFLADWQKGTYDVFNNFPKTGAVCPTPSSRSYKTYTSNIYWDNFFSKKMYFTAVKNPAALESFALSVGDKMFYNKYHIRKYLTVTKNKFRAVVGAGHFVTTYRGSVFELGISRYSKFKMGGLSESYLLDIPVVKKDFWRLSTEDNYTYHMGNVAEKWMKTEFNNLKKLKNEIIPCPEFTFYGSSKFVYWMKTKLFSKIIFKKNILKSFFKTRGLISEEAENY